MWSSNSNNQKHTSMLYGSGTESALLKSALGGVAGATTFFSAASCIRNPTSVGGPVGGFCLGIEVCSGDPGREPGCDGVGEVTRLFGA